LLTGIKVLVVEDNLVNQKITNFMLKKLNAIVSSAMNGNEAIELLKRNDYDVVLMDLQMPGMDGYATTDYIRHKLHNNVPVIAVTADIFVSETSDYLVSGMNACICKPFDANVLGEMILGLINVDHLASNQAV
jgi:CheY-like chemotaxis protein